MKNIIITGAGRGIGHEVALQLAEAGHQVLAISRNIPQDLINVKNITCLSVDITQQLELAKISDFITSSWKHVDAVIHNAGALILKPFAETSVQEFEDIYKVNVFGVVALTKLVLPFLVKGSHVVSISSMGGIQGSVKFAGLSAYSSSKGALITLSELLAEEYRDRGIAFNVLALGSVQTEMLAKAFPGFEAPLSASKMAEYISNFTLTGNEFYNGKVLEVSSTTP